MAEDTLLQEAIQALQKGERERAREILRRLLKAEQNNATYWLWMSAAVETQKERIYCLQTALRADPENAAARRGLVLLGAMPPDEDVQPFPLDRPRQWEEDLALAYEPPRPQGLKTLLTGPIGRLAALGLIVTGIIALAVYSFFAPRRRYTPLPTFTPGPSPTFTFTPTSINAAVGPTPTFVGPTPLWAILEATYTPTPLYVNTPRQPQSRDLYRIVREAYAEGDWPTVITSMEQIATLEPDAADPYYYIGEAYRFLGQYGEAFDAYTKAIEVNPDFGPAYVGRARVRYLMNPRGDNILEDFTSGIEKDPNFPEAYIGRAAYLLEQRDDPEAALNDLEQALSLSPDSALAHMYLARAYLALGETEEALRAAETAHQLDLTLIPAYRTLGRVYATLGRMEDALGPLQTYLLYEPDDAEALVLLGQAYHATGDDESAVDVLTRAVKINNKIGEIYLYRGLAYIGVGDGTAAAYDLKTALRYYPDSFEVSLGLARAYMLQEHYGDAYLQLERSKSLAESDEQKALVYYWRALSLEELENFSAAQDDWERLLALPASAMTPEMRATAREHLNALASPTPGPSPTKTATATSTPTSTATSTPTP
ncbi:MAG: tetratricopeptide repeat protein [Anaerolineae bacterium]|nr:MAG: tetratricopeptide repeat protein [Anaerolineae bacterium]